MTSMTWDQAASDSAAAEGWRLAVVVDNGATAPYLMVASSKGAVADRVALAHVVNHAKAGSTLHQRALQEVALSRIYQGKK